MTISRYIVYFIVGTIPILFAAVQPWIWSFYTFCIFAAFLILFWQNRINKASMPDKLYIFVLGLFYLITIVQCLPLPLSFLSFLSPFRHEVLTQSNSIINSSVSWQSISYSHLNSLAWWAFMLSLLLFFLVFRKCFSSYKNWKIIIYILLIVATLEALYGLLQALIPTMGVLWSEKYGFGSARGTYINRNHFAGFIEMILPLGLGYTLSLGN